MRKMFRRSSMVVIVLALVTGALASQGAGAQSADAPAPAGAGGCATAPGAQEAYCEGYIVFASAGDLWLVDTFGVVTQLTHTKIREANPSVAFPWVFYDARQPGNPTRNIWFLSLLDPGLGRVRVTERPTDDFDPTAVLPYFCCEPGMPTTPEELEASISEDGLLFAPLLAYSSDRFAGDVPKCGVELFAEYYLVSGPYQVSECDKHDKVDPEWDIFGCEIAYGGTAWATGDRQIFTTDSGCSTLAPDSQSLTGTTQLTTEGQNWGPTWSPQSLYDQPAGNDWLIFARGGGSLYEVFWNGVDYGPTDYSPTGAERFVLPELETNFYGMLWIRKTAHTSRIEFDSVWGDGILTPPDMKVQSADWASQMCSYENAPRGIGFCFPDV